MSNERNKPEFLDVLLKPTAPQVDAFLALPLGSKTKYPLARRCLRLLRIILEPFALAISGTVAGMVLVVVIHFAGLDPWVELLVNR